jgi:N-acetylmuramoyl-L-alanine amidase
MIFADLEYLARTIAGEARGESISGKVAVGKSIVNRYMISHRNESTIAGICTEPFQYSCWNRKDGNRTIIENMTFEELVDLGCITAAVFALDPRHTDETKGSTHYHTVKAPKGAIKWPPVWAEGHKPVIQIGNHYFYNTVK